MFRRKLHKSISTVALGGVIFGLTWASPIAIAQMQTPDSTAADQRVGVQSNSSFFSKVVRRAKSLADRSYVAASESDVAELPHSYDAYRKLVFDRTQAIWRGHRSRFEIHPLPAGWLFKLPIRLSVLEDGEEREIKVSSNDFLDGRQGRKRPAAEQDVPLSGFRINWPLNHTDKADEVIVFQGASYFRALAAGHRYGLSMRGLAINTASPRGEEFPAFREFWIVQPKAVDQHIVIFALLDSQSVTGAYEFTVRPGPMTTVDVKAVLFPRRELNSVGLAPLTSMFLVGPIDRARVDDYRPQVHDSDGVAIFNGNGERLWRPLANPHRLQSSAFIDRANRGFGLVQRNREFESFQDLEARYDLRPTAWIEPLSGFDSGSVVLIEIPTQQEIHDNIVAFWRRDRPLEAGVAFPYSYRIRMVDEVPTRGNGPFVAATRSGITNLAQVGDRRFLFVIDYVQQGERKALARRDYDASASASNGKIENLVVTPNSLSGGLRVSFEFTPGSAAQSDLRLDLRATSKSAAVDGESWLYRWNRKP